MVSSLGRERVLTRNRGMATIQGSRERASARLFNTDPPSLTKTLGGFFMRQLHWKRTGTKARTAVTHYSTTIEAGKNLFRTENAVLFARAILSLSRRRLPAILAGGELLASGLQQASFLGRISNDNPGYVRHLTTWAKTHAEAGSARQGGMRMGSSSHRPTRCLAWDASVASLALLA